MKTFEDLEGRTLVWKSVGFWRQHYELSTEDGEIFGTMHNVGGWARRAKVRILNLNVTFERNGFWRRRIAINSVGLESEIGSHNYQSHKGELTLANGETFLWKHKARLFKKTEWVWMTPDGTEIIRFIMTGRWGTVGEIHFPIGIEAKRGIPLLVALGWYLIVLQREEAATVVMISG